MANDSTAQLPASIRNLGNPTKYVRCADTAKLIRQALKEAFPEIKFSVRSSTYSGGASIRVGWLEGPLTAQVEAIAKSFQGSTFDSMQDLRSYNHHAIDGQPTHFGADHVFCNRDLDESKVKALASIFQRADKNDWLTLASRFGMGQVVLKALNYHCDATEIAYAILQALPQPQFEGRKSATVENITSLD